MPKRENMNPPRNTERINCRHQLHQIKLVPNKKVGRHSRNDNLRVDYATLVRLVARIAPAYRHADGRHNNSGIARKVFTDLKKANGGLPLRGHSEEAIKDRIEEAMSVAREVLPSDEEEIYQLGESTRSAQKP